MANLKVKYIEEDEILYIRLDEEGGNIVDTFEMFPYLYFEVDENSYLRSIEMLDVNKKTYELIVLLIELNCIQFDGRDGVDLKKLKENGFAKTVAEIRDKYLVEQDELS